MNVPIKGYKYIHTSIHYKILMLSPCNIDWIYPTQNMLAKQIFMMLKYTTHIHTCIITHHMGTCHFFSLQSIKI